MQVAIKIAKSKITETLLIMFYFVVLYFFKHVFQLTCYPFIINTYNGEEYYLKRKHLFFCIEKFLIFCCCCCFSIIYYFPSYLDRNNWKWHRSLSFYTCDFMINLDNEREKREMRWDLHALVQIWYKFIPQVQNMNVFKTWSIHLTFLFLW